MFQSTTSKKYALCLSGVVPLILGFPDSAYSESRDNRTPHSQRPAVTKPSVIQRASDTNGRQGSGDSVQLSIDVVGSNLIDAADQHCRELVALAQAEGHNPGSLCRDSEPTFNTGGSVPEVVIEEDPTPAPVELKEDVLLIHGFSITANHDCSEYWGAQQDAINTWDSEDNQIRHARTIGWYGATENCDVNIPDDNPADPSPDPLEIGYEYGIDTPISDVAYELKTWILDNYASKGKSVDIVAHSLGGLVVRLMLENWGQELLVSDVVTLGTPHDGVDALILAPVCWAIAQCNDVEKGSDFINNLQHNPQSVIATQWTLIAAENDQVIGEATGLGMESMEGPVVDKYEYSMDHKHGCSHIFGLFSSIGHQDLQGDAASKPVHECNIFGFSNGTVDNPTQRILNAID